eukprot:754905-Prymnesium_polylepis.1
MTSPRNSGGDRLSGLMASMAASNAAKNFKKKTPKAEGGGSTAADLTSTIASFLSTSLLSRLH